VGSGTISWDRKLGHKKKVWWALSNIYTLLISFAKLIFATLGDCLWSCKILRHREAGWRTLGDYPQYFV
jgi:hypothetical protein